jgi:diadenosine tetraphosphate (Ap4A) HIT family hydrolase
MKPNAIFGLHPQLDNDCIPLGRLSLCRLLLMNESRYPWLILVPERPGITEVFELNEVDQLELIRESCLMASHLKRVFAADKMNVASIGNLVPQLHLHHVARYRTDAAWPAPVWGRFAPVPYAPEGLKACLEKMNLLEIPDFSLTVLAS